MLQRKRQIAVTQAILAFACSYTASALATDKQTTENVGSDSIRLRSKNTLLSYESAAGDMTETLYKLVVNGKAYEKTYIVLQDTAKEIYLSRTDLIEIGLDQFQSQPVLYQGMPFYRLSLFPKSSFAINQPTQSVAITFDLSLLKQQDLSLQKASSIELSPSANGVFANYNLLATRQAGQQALSGFIEGGLLFGSAVGVANFLLSSQEKSRNKLQAIPARRLVRLDTAWRQDDPKRLATLIVGDSFQRTSTWGRSIRFGGVSFGTNFALQPGLITAPVEAVSGLSSLPSVADVYVNQQLAGSQPLQPGPFSLDDVPLINGAGEISVVVRDLLGREQIISKPFYNSQKLLRKGMLDYAVEVGLARNNYGLTSADYGPVTASVLYRYGVSDKTTAEARVYHVGHDVAAGVSIDWLANLGFGSPGLQGLARTRLIASRTMRDEAPFDVDSDSGLQIGVGFERDFGMLTNRRPYTFVIDASTSSAGFRLPGSRVSEPQVLHQISASAGTRFAASSLSVTYISQHYASTQPFSSLSLGYSMPFLGRAVLNGFLSMPLRNRQSLPSATLFISLTLPFGHNSQPSTASVDLTSGSGGAPQISTVVQSARPTGPGLSYRALARNNGALQTGLLLQTNEVVLTAEYGRNEAHQDAIRLGMQGGIGMVGGHAFAARSLENGFAIVKVDDYPGVKVYRENHLTTVTNSKGYAVVPSLIPFVPNRLSIDVSDLPIDTQIISTSLNVTPHYRGGAFVAFPVNKGQGVTFRVTDENGRDLQLGTMVQNNKGSFPVGYEGQVYIADVDTVDVGQRHFQSLFKNKPCRFALPADKPLEPIPDLGTIQCKVVP